MTSPSADDHVAPQRGRSSRRWVLLAIVFAGVASLWYLGIGPGDLLPNEGGLRTAGKFFRAAATPAFTYQGENIPADAPPLLIKALTAAFVTAVFALAAIGLSMVVGLPLGFLGSTAWWEGDHVGAASPTWLLVRRLVSPVIFGVTRVVIAIARSVHELLWAVLFLAAVGLSPLAAVLAITIPYAGTLAKISSELIDETPRDAAHAMRDAGATPLQVFCVGLLPRAFPDLLAYTMYRFECGIRSAAVLGFFAIPTLGYYIKLSFDNTHFTEVWTYLYTLFVLIIIVDWWSGAVRRRLTA